jgi:hypothetical protein
VEEEAGVTLPLPSEQWAKLASLQAAPAVGDVWNVPKEHVRFPGGKPRRCLLVWLEPPEAPVRAHLIAGTGNSGPPPRIVVEPDDDNGLDKKTYFKFQDPVEELDVVELKTVATRVGRVSDSERAGISAAIAASSLVALKQLVKGKGQ